MGDEAIGRELVDWGPAEVHLVDIALLPTWTGRGIGSALVRDLVEHARASNRAVVLEVARDNHRALALYRRLGFVDGDHSTPSHQALRHT